MHLWKRIMFGVCIFFRYTSPGFVRLNSKFGKPKYYKIRPKNVKKQTKQAILCQLFDDNHYILYAQENYRHSN